jgi:hypothetical protein
MGSYVPRTDICGFLTFQMNSKGFDMRIFLKTLSFLIVFFVTPCYAYHGCPDSIHNYYDCQRYLEEKLASQYPNLLSRNGQVLKIKLSNSKVKEFKNASPNTPEDKYIDFAFVRYFPEIKYGLIYEQYTENGTYELIDMTTGKMNEIYGNAEISPDKQRLAVFTFFEFHPLGFAVYLVTNKGIVQEFKTDNTAEWATWKNNKTVDIDFYDEAFGNRKGTLKFIGSDVKTKGSWELGTITK